MYSKTLIKKIQNRSAKVAVIGLGYVGLPLAIEFAKAGFETWGIDVVKSKIDSLKKGQSYILDVPGSDVAEMVAAKRFRATAEFSVLKKLDAVCICVPTPLAKTKIPDISYILAAVHPIKKFLHKGMAVVLESTTYPGTTDEVILPILNEAGLTVGKDFFLAFSPERVDPSNPEFKTKNIPKVIGGVTPECGRVVGELYGAIVNSIVPVSTPRAAEMVKLVENTFRSVNIGLANELCLICNKLGINVWEVIDAAKTKPFGFMPFYPGPGLGGHCIPIDPCYLSWKARVHDFEPRFIELATEINRRMPEYVVSRIQDLLNSSGKAILGSKVLVVGVAYKKDVDDVRESPALDVIEMLQQKGAQVTYSDPFIREVTIGEKHNMTSILLTAAALRRADVAVILTDHSGVDYRTIEKNARLVLDTRNILKNIKAKHIFYL